MPTTALFIAKQPLQAVCYGMAKLLSVLFHPGFFPVYVFVGLWFFGQETAQAELRQQASFYLLLLAVLTLAPALYVYFAFRNLNLPDRQQRHRPYLFSAALFLLAAALLFVLDSGPLFRQLLGISGISLLLLFLLNRFIKLSMHLYGLTGGFVLLWQFGVVQDEWLVVSFTAAIWLLLLVGLSRYYLRAHTLPELLAGVTSGFVIFIGLTEIWAAIGG